MSARARGRHWIFGAIAAGMASGAWAAPCPSTAPTSVAAPVFSVPRISYDRQCYTIDGKDTFLFSAAFHYFRCPKPLWADRFARLKAAGFNTVETYVAWNWHEQTPPSDPDDFSKLQNLDDLRDWLTMATQQFGLNVMLRPGPYICAEWDGGGYPQWLITKKPAGYHGLWFRSADPTYLAWCKHWYTAVARVAAPFQITRQPAGKPGIISWQLENEYNYDGAHSPQVHHDQLLALAHDARDLGIDVPLFTCQTNGPLLRQDAFLKANVLETLNAYPKYDMKNFARGLDGLGNYQPEKLRSMTELQGGWFADVGGKLSAAQGFSADQIQHLTLLAWAHGFTSTNYYMGFGGTNFGDWAAHGITTTYDYDAPVREDGGVTARYAAVAGLGQLLKLHGSQLVRAVDVPIKLTGAPPHVTARLRRSSGGAQFLFLFNDAVSDPARGSLTVDSPGNDEVHLPVNVDLAPFQAKILYLPDGAIDAAQGEWLPTPAPLPPRPSTLPAAVAITDVRTRVDPGPSDWRRWHPGESEIDAGIFDRRFVFYRTTLPAGASNVSALAGPIGTLAMATHDGQALSPLPRPKKRGATPTIFAVPPSSTDATSRLTFVVENAGRPNFGDGLEQTCGLVSATATVGNNTRPLPLEIASESAGRAGQWWSPTLDESDWTPVSINSPAATRPTSSSLVWYRLHFPTPAIDPHAWMAWHLHLDAVGNGFLYLNDHPLGRWWQVGPQQDFFLPSCWMNPGGSNVITLCLRPNHDVAEVKTASIAPDAETAETR